ncbi:MAG: IS4 family transposase [bacterium]
MPYYGQRKLGEGVKLTEIISMGALARVIPAKVVDEALDEHGGKEKRNRLLPARVTVYYIILMTIYSHLGYREILHVMVEGFKALFKDLAGWHVPHKSAVTQARARVGVAPMEGLYRRIAKPIAAQETKGAWYRQWRLTSFDGTTVDIADTPDNETVFGRPGNGRSHEKSAYPQARLVALCEQGTHVLADAEIGSLATGEQKLARHLLRSLEPGMLNLADRNFFSFALWKDAAATGAQLLWRVKKNLILDPVEVFKDGSFTAWIYPNIKARRQQTGGMLVRVIEYTIDDPGRTDTEPKYRLITTILKPGAAVAHELARVYEQRQEIEFTFDELKTHQRGARMVFRSKTPNGVFQELYGYLLAHFAIRGIMHEAALALDIDPDRVSFTNTIRIIRRKLQRFQTLSPLPMG